MVCGCGWREQERGAGRDGEQGRQVLTLVRGTHRGNSEALPEAAGMAELKGDFSEPPSHTTPVGIQPCLGSQLAAAL